MHGFLNNLCLLTCERDQVETREFYLAKLARLKAAQLLVSQE